MSARDRTPEERERARLEREARRAAREGRPPPAALPPIEVPPPAGRPQDDEPSRRGGVEAPAPPPRPRQAPEPSPPPEPPRRFEPPQVPEPPLPPQPPQARPPRPPEPPQRPEPPPPPRFPPGPPRHPPPPLRPGRLAAGNSDGAGGGGPRIRRRLLPLLALGAATLVALWFLLSLLQPLGGDGEGEVRVTIPQGAGVGEIADLLAERGIVSSAFFFEARARLAGSASDLKAGTFRLRRDMSHAAALEVLTEAPPPNVVRVTIPEGRARREVRRVVERQLDGDYLALTRRSRLLDPRRYGAARARDLEGFLFPATYELKRGRPLRDLVDAQLRTFKREFDKVDLRPARRRKLTPYDVITIASMVDREAQLPRERRLIASVIYNRLREGIPLGIDATIRFATGNWTRPLRQSQLSLDSPYNTRTRRGLPPGPIGSPGLAAIRAAARPAATRFLFYVVKPGTCGAHAFSRTDAEFQRDVRRYNSERSRRGGKSPTDC